MVPEFPKKEEKQSYSLDRGSALLLVFISRLFLMSVLSYFEGKCPTFDQLCFSFEFRSRKIYQIQIIAEKVSGKHTVLPCGIIKFTEIQLNCNFFFIWAEFFHQIYWGGLWRNEFKRSQLSAYLKSSKI